jgi:hypothetical protein
MLLHSAALRYYAKQGRFASPSEAKGHHLAPDQFFACRRAFRAERHDSICKWTQANQLALSLFDVSHISDDALA